jgi:hypothetical protein
MTERQAERLLAQAVGLGNESFRVKGSNAFMVPIGGLVRAVILDRTSDKNEFKVLQNVLPLCCPAEHLHLLFAKDVRRDGKMTWPLLSPDTPEKLARELSERVIPFLESFEDMAAFLNYAKGFPQWERRIEAEGYVLARIGEYDGAREYLRRALAGLTPAGENMRAVVERIELLLKLMDESPERTQEQLSAWEEYTAERLGLSKWRVRG